jgi:DNA-directed RNA polymerase
VQTLAGSLVLQHEEPATGLRKSKQRKAAAPNVVHSLDASHLCRTVNACARVGLLDFSAIHDSYRCHAGDIPLLAYILRDQFEQMHSILWLQEIEDYVRSSSPPGVLIPSWSDYITLGTADLMSVMRAEFAFA